MFTLLKKLVRITLIALVVMFLLLSLLPYLFSLKNQALTTQVLPYTNSHYEIQGDYFVHYQMYVPEKIEHKLFLLHGFSGSTFSYHNVVDSLVNNNCLVVAADLPPFGYSVKNRHLNYSDTVNINLFKKIIGKADSVYSNNSKWIICGHSMGVMYASKFVSRYPECFAKQIFIDGYYSNTNGGGLTKISAYPPFMRLADVALEKYYLNEEKFSELLKSAYGREPEKYEVKGYMQPFAFKESGAAILKWTAASKNIKINEDLIRSKPTLVIWGKNDTWLPYKEEDFKLNLFKDVSFKMIDDAGHVPMETHAEEVNKFLRTFIKE